MIHISESTLARAADSQQIERGTPALTLMERAAEGLYAAAEGLGGLLEKLQIAIFCGDGNNGGDGFAAARLLLGAGADVRCYFIGEHSEMTPQTTVNFTRFCEGGGKVDRFNPSDRDTVEFCRRADLIIDAMYGIGFYGNLSGNALEAARLINWSPATVISADLPSGAHADTALADTECVRADITIAFACYKPAHFVLPAKSYCGEVRLCDIGISMEISDELNPQIVLLDQQFAQANLKQRVADSHKGDYGKVLIIGGSVGLTGAPMLAAKAAYRAGAGLVYLAAPECVYPILAGRSDEVVCLPVPSTSTGYSAKALDTLVEHAKNCDVVVIGPGLGRSKETSKLVCDLLDKIKKPVILDADGINALDGNINIVRSRTVATVLTPHDVEFSRLGGNVSKGRLVESRRLAALAGATVLLKGNTTVVSAGDGFSYVNNTGNSGMAKGGSGDVLCGVIAAFIAGGCDPTRSAAIGTYIHGRAGDLAAAEMGEAGMMPSDLIAKVPQALRFLDSNKYTPNSV